MKNVFRFFAVILFIFLINSCNKDNSKLPVLDTTYISDLAKTTVTSGGNVINDGGATNLTRGVCWSTATSPKISDNKTIDGSGIGTFTSLLTGLVENTTYFIRAYATNSAGTAYGEEFRFTTYNVDAIADIENNYYNIVTIGFQTWMSENLKTTRFNNGDLIGTSTPYNKDISLELTPKYQWAYEGNETKVATYGRLYTWDAVTDSRKVCPIGWHVPSDDELTMLTTYLGGESVAGGKLKEAGYIHWTTPNTGATNETGFTALPSGCRYVIGTFSYIRYLGYLWSSTEESSTYGYMWFMNNDASHFIGSRGLKPDGLSVRCLRDF